MNFMKFINAQYRILSPEGDPTGGGSNDPSNINSNSAQPEANAGAPAPSGMEPNNNPSGEPASGTPAQDINSLPQWAQDQIKGLRGESAKYRTERNNSNTSLDSIKTQFSQMLGLSPEDQSTPEEQLSTMTEQMNGMSYENALTNVAYENGIPYNQVKYFSFLMSDATESLQEGEELSEEIMMNIITKCKGAQAPNSSSVPSQNNSSGNQTPANNSDVTLDQFNSMGTMEKSRLYREKPEVYKSLFNQSKFNTRG